MTTDLITLQQVQDLAYKIAQETPKAVNPIIRHMCQYDLDGRHCYVGEIFTRLGVALPPEGEFPDATPDRARFEQDTLDWLKALQGYADTDGLGVSNPWGVAYDLAAG